MKLVGMIYYFGDIVKEHDEQFRDDLARLMEQHRVTRLDGYKETGILRAKLAELKNILADLYECMGGDAQDYTGDTYEVMLRAQHALEE
jgi:hypothetical protein